MGKSKNDVTKFYSDSIQDINNQLLECNKNINEKFDSLKGEIAKLNSAWTGNAGDEAERRFAELEKLKIKRDNQFKKITDMLAKIKDGYIQTEQNNNSLAKRFK